MLRHARLMVSTTKACISIAQIVGLSDDPSEGFYSPLEPLNDVLPYHRDAVAARGRSAQYKTQLLPTKDAFQNN